MKEVILTLIFMILVMFTIMVVSYSYYDFYKDALKQHDHKIVRHSSKGYDVYEIYDLLSPGECKQLIADAKEKGLDTSLIWDYSGAGNQIDDSHRKSKQTWFTDEEHAISSKLGRITTYITGIPQTHQEALQVAMYEPSGKFNEHYDACVGEDKAYCDKMNAHAGQRRATLLVYLNDGFEGGNTEFVNVGISITPAKGKGILFWNTRDDESIIDESKHKGSVVVKGEKWIATKWTHKYVYPNIPDVPDVSNIQ